MTKRPKLADAAKRPSTTSIEQGPAKQPTTDHITRKIEKNMKTTVCSCSQCAGELHALAHDLVLLGYNAIVGAIFLNVDYENLEAIVVVRDLWYL